ncbi:MAG: hypothetical protein JST54_35010 [Deltaproteobacteria bacterium]|nr:hypothetical protein [Deltaproteobacteria bacterium]
MVAAAPHGALDALPDDYAAVDHELDGSENPKGSRVEIPAEVRSVIDRLAREEFDYSRSEKGRGFFGRPEPLRRHYGPTYFATLANGRRLFMFKRLGPSSGIVGIFPIVYDPVTRRATQRPPRIDWNWTEGNATQAKSVCDPRQFECRPYMQERDIDGDGQPELVFEKRAHNGTLYNAALYQHFHIGEDLELTPVLTIEARSLCEGVSDEGVWADRTFVLDGACKGRLVTRYRSYDKSSAVTELGDLELACEKPGQPFKELVRHLRSRKVGDFLTTCNESLRPIAEPPASFDQAWWK